MKHQTQTPVHASIYADIYEGKYRFGKKGTLRYIFQAFYRVISKKKNVFFPCFCFVFFSVNNPLIFQVANLMGK